MMLNNRYLRKTLLVLTDFTILVLSALLTNWILDPFLKPDHFYNFILAVLVPLFGLFLVGFYRLHLSNSTFEVFKRAMWVAIPVFLIIQFTDSFRWSFVNTAFSFSAILIVRGFYRMFYEHHNKSRDALPTAVILGAGELGCAMARLGSKGLFDHRILGFVDDDPKLQKEIILGYKVLGTSNDLVGVLNKFKPETLIIAVTSITSEKIQSAVKAAKDAGCRIKIVPNLFERKGRADVSPRDINFSDLLGRKLIEVDREPLLKMLAGKTVLVTGAGGSIGSEISSQLLDYDIKKLILLDIDETELHDLSLRLLDYKKEWSDDVVPVVCDLKNRGKVDQIIKQYHPDIIFHAAAYKHVPLMQLYPEEAINNNIVGSYNLFKSAKDNAVPKVVVISTDKAVNPTNIMGTTKRVVEMLAAAINTEHVTEFCCVRFGNVIGSRGSMFPLFMEQIKAGKPITVTHENVIRYFMAIPEAVSLVFRAATLAKGGEVMVLDMGQPVRIYDFAQKLIDVFGDGRSSITITGLRPGEKLYEELLANDDLTVPTDDKLVFKAKLSETNLKEEDFMEFLHKLPGMDRDEMIKWLKFFVPEYHPSTKQ